MGFQKGFGHVEGLKWFPWGSFCPSASNRPELHQFRPFFWGNVWIHLPCSQLWVVLYDGFVFSILVMNFILSTKWRFIFSELRGTFKEIFGTLDGFPKGIGSLGWIWSGFHAVHSAHQHPIDQKYATFSEQSMFEFTDLVFICDGGVLGLFWFGILDFRFFWSWILDSGILDLRFLDFGILEFGIFRGFWMFDLCDFGMLDFGIWGFCDFGMLDFGILDFGSQQKTGVTWQRSTMVPGPKVYNGTGTISDPAPVDPWGATISDPKYLRVSIYDTPAWC